MAPEYRWTITVVLFLASLVGGFHQQDSLRANVGKSNSASLDRSTSVSKDVKDAGRVNLHADERKFDHCYAKVQNNEEVCSPMSLSSNSERLKEKSQKEGAKTEEVPQAQSGQEKPGNFRDCDDDVSGNLFQRSVEGLVDQVQRSKMKVIESLEDVMDQVAQSRDRVMDSLDKVMDRVSESMSESRVKVIESFDSVMDKVSESKEKVLRGLDEVIDKVAHSKMMEELDHVIDQVAHSKVMEEIRALPEEIRQSFVLSVRNRSYVAAGVMVAITTAILVAGAVYYSWCHQDAWAYYVPPLNESEDPLKRESPEVPSSAPLINGIQQGSNGTFREGSLQGTVNAQPEARNGKVIEDGDSCRGSPIIENGDVSKDVLENGDVSEDVLENGNVCKDVLENGIVGKVVLENRNASKVLKNDSDVPVET
ncbi:uncharacterized protein LOC101854258 [Aplysia californica]|uniref:Uncharacterized protein LOC101854258 n=1 Tax=Aplysia californica TaxID=6500 RepID=A0ABM0JQR1_APLCA|nr:uncharacterized protein LOC101854258 [Aplysia californica]